MYNQRQKQAYEPVAKTMVNEMVSANAGPRIEKEERTPSKKDKNSFHSAPDEYAASCVNTQLV